LALPPLAEQSRIAAKVEELLALCDELEMRQVATQECRTRLVHSALDHLTAANDEQSFQKQCSFILQNSSLILDSVPAVRQASLSLAVQGRLVPQSPKDEPASGLLKQIGIAREHLVKEKKLAASTRMKIKELPSTRLPTGWTWAPFGEVTFCRDGERIPVNSDDRENLEKTYDYYGASGVIDRIDRYLFDKPLLLIGEDGANLVNRATAIAFIAEGKYWVNNHAHVLDAIDRTLLEYLRIYINSINLEPYLTGMAQPKMNQAQMNSIPIALPPLAEQQRIVAKVDELMRWCDALEARLAAAETTAAHLLDATLDRALKGEL
jgi:type I restriction enzyme S subunit